MSNQVEIKFMISKLNQWNQQLGGVASKRAFANSQFDFLQQQFLSKRHLIQRCQDIKQKQGFTTANANIGHQIREGIKQLQNLLGRLKQQYRRLEKKKKDSADVLERKKKIVENCQLLLQDIEQRQNGQNFQTNKNKVVTITDMKAKLLRQIDENNDKIHDKVGSDGKLSQLNEDDKNQLDAWKKKDQELDDMLDDVINGVKIVKGKVQQINQKQDKVQQLTKKANKKAQKVQTRIKKDNAQLKQLIQKFKPNRCCLFIGLFLLFTGLIVCIIKILI